MAAKHIKKSYYTVSGTGQFPIDMLRYDQAVPASERDSSRISRSFNRHAGELTVSLVSEHEPTRARWSSFRWSVTDIERR